MKLKSIVIVLKFVIILVSCKNASDEETKDKTAGQPVTMQFQNKGHELVFNMVERVGNLQKLRSKKNVVYTYSYTTPDGSSDISTEKYIFDGELSYAKYEKHQRSLPELGGTMEQGFDGKNYWIKVDGELVNNIEALNKVKFSRHTNFYWFAMFQKLLDPGLKYEYLGDQKVDDKNFEIVKVSFDSKNGKPTDIYQLYINQETGVVDQFLFTVADFGVLEEPLLMQLEYEKADGMLVPTKRRYKKSNWDAEVSDSPWILVKWSNIKFDNNLHKEEFQK